MILLYELLRTVLHFIRLYFILIMKKLFILDGEK